jgi:hypothetical protein
MKLAGFYFSLVLFLGFMPPEALGEGAPKADVQEFLALLHADQGAVPAAKKPKRPRGFTKAFCEAQCNGGTTVSVNCTGSCIAVDQNCSAPPTQQGGYAQCPGGSPVYCPLPCPCEATAICGDGSVAHCEGTNFCVANNYCFAYCDGTYFWCPGAAC